MPIYEYHCLACHHEFELLQKFSDPPLAQCPSCAGQVRKLISRSAFHLKGDGWYATDYARKSNHDGKSKTSDTTGNTSTDSSASESASPTPTQDTTKAASSTTDTTTS
jgi:putative FmdB family regulatory protein